MTERNYTIKQLADLAGISTRTLRWYESYGLLAPVRRANGYRSYGVSETERLQQILLYRELGFELSEIAELLESGGANLLERLNWQLTALRKRKKHVEALIDNVERTIKSEEMGIIMNENERFEAFKQKALEENEAQYGKEIREKYGDKAVEESNAKFAGMTPEQHAEMEQLTKDLADALKAAVATGDPTGEQARTVAAMHKKWLMFFWPKYSAEQHRGVTQMYVEDERFKKYYEDIVSGGAQFIRDAVWAWLEADEEGKG